MIVVVNVGDDGDDDDDCDEYVMICDGEKREREIRHPNKTNTHTYPDTRVQWPRAEKPQW